MTIQQLVALKLALKEFEAFVDDTSCGANQPMETEQLISDCLVLCNRCCAGYEDMIELRDGEVG